MEAGECYSSRRKRKNGQVKSFVMFVCTRVESSQADSGPETRFQRVNSHGEYARESSPTGLCSSVVRSRPHPSEAAGHLQRLSDRFGPA
jgi:hypothetical protein